MVIFTRSLLATLLAATLVAPNVASAATWQSPLTRSTCIASPFGRRNLSIKGSSKFHAACDLRAGCGSNVVATRGGKVVFARWYRGYGYQVRIDHGDGTSSRYSHLQKGSFKFREGQTVSAGQTVALSGNTSSLNRLNKKPLACHLHFEILVGGQKVNPAKYIRWSRCGARRGVEAAGGGARGGGAMIRR